MTANSKPEKSYLAAAAESISPWGPTRSSTPKPPTDNLDPSAQQQGGDHSVNHRYGLSARRYPKDCPPLKTRWFYAVDVPKRKPKLLKEAGEPRPLTAPKKFVTFSEHDSKDIEKGYQKLAEEEEDNQHTPHPTSSNTQNNALGQDNKQNTSITEAGANEQAGGRVNVPVNEDYLFDVDVERRELAPVYWLGPIYEVRRGAWFYVESAGLRPCEENLASQLEEGYLKVKPFRYPKPKPIEKAPPRPRPVSMRFDDPKILAAFHTKDTAGSKEVTPRSSFENLKIPVPSAPKDDSEPQVPASAPQAHQPQTYRLFGTYMNSIVTYQDDTVAWLSSDTMLSRVSSTVYQRFAGGGYMGGVKIVRGYTDGKSQDSKTEVPTPSTPNFSRDNTNPGLQPDERQQRLLKRRSAPPGTFDEAETPKGSGPSNPPSQQAELGQKLTDMVTNTLGSAAGADAILQREEKEIQNDYQDHAGEDQAREIEHLVLVTHGIGQRLGMRTASVNFVHDVNVLRQTLKSVYTNSADLQALNSEIEKLPKNCRVQVLPVCWRHLLDFPKQGRQQSRKEHDIGDALADDDEYPTLEDISPEGVPFIRSLITDMGLDILLYQSAYREHISGIVLKECNRIYKLFLDRNPSFNGKVSLVGHSLGSAILFDILCRQKEDVVPHRHSHHHHHHHQTPRNSFATKHDQRDLSFDFSVEDFYCWGSPIGLFQMLKGRTIAARHDPNALPAESPMNPDALDDPFLSMYSSYAAGERISPTTGLPYTISSPKCVRLYNVFHPSDPISYRLEPLIAPAMRDLKPQALPYTKGGLFGAAAGQGFSGIGNKVSQSVSGLWSSLSSSIASGLLNRSLGLTGEDVASMGAVTPTRASAAAGTNITSGGVITADVPTLTREDTSEKMNQLAKDTAQADRDGTSDGNAATLIDDEMETLYAGFQKRRKQSSAGDEDERAGANWVEAEEKARRLRREELKVRGLNQTGRVDFVIQEYVLYPISY